MKKSLAIVLLIIGGLAANFVMSSLNLVLFFTLMGGGILIGIALAMAAAFGLDCLRKLFRRKYGLNAAKFFLCAYAPPIVGAGILLGVVLLLDAAGYFSGLFAGLGEFIAALSCVITSGALAAAGGLWLAVSAVIERRRANLPTFTKPVAIVVLMIGSAVLWTGMIFGTERLWTETESVIPSVLIILAVTFGIDVLRKVYGKRFGIGASVFYLCSYFAALGWKIYSFYVYFERLSADRDYGFPTAADNAFFLRYVPIEAAAIVIGAVVWFAVSAAVGRRKGNSV